MKQIFTKLKNTNETLLACIVILIVALIFGFYGFRVDNSFGFKCSDFETPEKYTRSLAKWIKNYMEKYPEATAEDMMAVRDKLKEENECERPNFTLSESASTLAGNESNNFDIEKALDSIKQVESEQPPRIVGSPSDEEIYNNPYIKHIRTALNGYLDGTNNGIENGVIEPPDDMPDCGLNTLDKSYYKSKFIVFGADDGEYGGVQADIVFIDKPDAIFWAWVYRYAGDNDEYVLRGFCKNGPKEEFEEKFSEMMKEIIKKSKFSL